MCKREKISLMVKTRILMVLKLLLNTQMTWMKMREHNPNKKHKILIVFDDLIADILSNKTLNLISTELFIRGGKLNIPLLFIKQSYAKKYYSNYTHYFIMEIPNKQELQQIMFKNLSDIDFKDFMNHYKNVLENHILFWLLMLLLHQRIFHISERFF